ncbi:MAG: hypothetical protein HXY48_13445 [Ignavibacteriaceae bacterium]|jgi:hypothetical protein|nr:hypothetical protein [Ignavibacteriaceae bacterium]
MKILLIILTVFTCFSVIFAQTDTKASLSDEEISELTSKLSMKLLLNENQKSGITKLLKTYSTELEKFLSGSAGSSYKNEQELINATSSQIESILDSKQKMKYDVLKKDWLTSVSSEASD